MHRYYTFDVSRGNSVVHVWEPGETPKLYIGHFVIDGDTAVLRQYFDEPSCAMIYVPWDIVRVLTEGI